MKEINYILIIDTHYILQVFMPVAAGYLHDAIYQYAITIDKILSENGNPRDGTDFIDKLTGTEYHSK